MRWRRRISISSRGVAQQPEDRPVLPRVPRPRLLEHPAHLVVGQPAGALDHRLGEAPRAHLPIAADVEERRQREARHPGAQRAEAVGQPLREHRHRALGEVDAGAAAVGLEVEGAALAHVVRHAGDVDPEPEGAAGETLERDRVVEVARALAVDGHDHRAAQVLAARPIVRRRVGRAARRLAPRRLGDLLGNAVVAQHHQHVDARRVRAAEHLDDPAARRAAAAAGGLDRHHDELVLEQLLAALDLDVEAGLGIEGHQPAAVAAQLERAHRRLHLAVEDLDHRRLGQALAARRRLALQRLEHHGVAVGGALERPARDVEARLAARPGAGQRVAALEGLDHAHRPLAVPHGVDPPRPLDQLARRPRAGRGRSGPPRETRRRRSAPARAPRRRGGPPAPPARGARRASGPRRRAVGRAAGNAGAGSSV